MDWFSLFLAHYGGAAMVLVGFLGNVGVPFPAFPVFVLAGALSSTVHASFPALVGGAVLGTVVADLARRRGSVNGIHVRGSMRNVVGEVPLAEARGYATALRDFTHGRGTFTLEFRRYDVVPDGIAEEIIKQRRADGKISER